jgi:hypothetical protein
VDVDLTNPTCTAIRAFLQDAANRRDPEDDLAIASALTTHVDRCPDCQAYFTRHPLNDDRMSLD